MSILSQFKNSFSRVKEIKSYVNDMRRPFNVDELKPIIRYISLRDFISDEPKERWSLSIGIAVMEVRDCNIRLKNIYK